jgi:hypothetical protein
VELRAQDRCPRCLRQTVVRATAPKEETVGDKKKETLSDVLSGLAGHRREVVVAEGGALVSRAARTGRVEEHMVRALRDHRLEILVDTEGVRVAVMRREGTGVYLVQICETPTGLTITGDLLITDLGVVHARGKSLAWFAGELGESYLAEKFLQKGWNVGLAREDLQVIAQNDDPDAQVEPLTLACLNEELRRDREDELRRCCAAVAEEMQLERTPGFGYDPVEVGWLAAVQQRFSALWRERDSGVIDTCGAEWRKGEVDRWDGGAEYRRIRDSQLGPNGECPHCGEVDCRCHEGVGR